MVSKDSDLSDSTYGRAAGVDIGNWRRVSLFRHLSQ